MLVLATALLAIAVAGEAMTIHFRGARLSGSFAALVLAMALLGPLPAAAIALASVVVAEAVCRRPLPNALWNAATFAAFPLIGGALLHLAPREDPIGFAAAVVAVFMLTNALNFASVAAYLHVSERSERS